MKKLVLLLCLLAPMTLAAQTPLHPQLSLVNPCPQPTSFCRYLWNSSTACCNPSFIAPGASCPKLCQ
ncbi:MAG TPA: hypothetical protein VIE43_17550 [Thermoanaerobaculia bacterium]|nr:hypothetical protein [Thermoanaerobaculia bacterium]